MAQPYPEPIDGRQQNVHYQPYVTQPSVGPVFVAAPAPVVVAEHHSRYSCSSVILSLIVLIAGFCFCPIWCLGWAFVRKGGAARGLGICSLIFATMAVIGLAIGLGMGLGPGRRGGLCLDDDVSDCLYNSNCGWCTGRNECMPANTCRSGQWLRDVNSICNSYSNDFSRCTRTDECQVCSNGCHALHSPTCS